MRWKRGGRPGLIVFAAVLLALVAALKVANWLPTAVQKGALQSYGDIEEMKRALNFKEVRVPSYFPESVSWPPSAILAQGRPFKAVLLEFSRAGDEGPVLVITQSASAGFPPSPPIRLSEVSERIDYDLRETTALLEVGLCPDGARCSRISWQEGGYRFSVAMRAAPFDLVRIAHSMGG